MLNFSQILAKFLSNVYKIFVKLIEKIIFGMDFRPNVTPIEVIKKGAFGGTYFRDIYYGVNGKWYEKKMERL